MNSIKYPYRVVVRTMTGEGQVVGRHRSFDAAKRRHNQTLRSIDRSCTPDAPLSVEVQCGVGGTWTRV